MTDQLTGYEASSVEEVEAVLDSVPTDAEEVYLRTIGHSERAIAAVAAKRAGGGGGGSMPLSYLAVFGLSFPTISVADEAQAFDYPPEIQVGSDITLSPDGLTFTIETDGWYELFLLYEFVPGDDTSKGMGTTAWFASGYDPDRCPIWGEGMGAQACYVPVDGTFSLLRRVATHHMPASFITAGTTLQVVAKYAELGAGSIKYSANAWIQRTA